MLDLEGEVHMMRAMRGVLGVGLDEAGQGRRLTSRSCSCRCHRVQYSRIEVPQMTYTGRCGYPLERSLRLLIEQLE